MRPASHLVSRVIAATTVLGPVLPVRAQSDIAFPAAVYAERRARLANTLGESVIVIPGRYLINPGDGLVKQDPNFWYLTGVESPYAILVMRVGAQGASPRVRSSLFLPTDYQFAGGQLPLVDEGFRRAVWNRPRRRLIPNSESARLTLVDETIAVDSFVPRFREIARGATTIFVPQGAALYAPPGLAAPKSSEDQLTSQLGALVPGATIANAGPAIEQMRLIKDSHEIAALRRAASISAVGMREAMTTLRPGMNDRELAGYMEYVWKREGSNRSSFAPIVSSGPNAMTFFSVLRENYNAVDRVMNAGDLVFVDYGAAEFNMYTADLCRTWPVSGKFTAEQRKYYDIVLEAQEAAIAAIKPGVMMVDVIRVAARVFQKHGLEQYEDVATMGADKVWGIMPSPTHYLTRNAGIVRYSPLGRGVRDLGHHIGLEVQDSRDYTRPLAPGMVITVEPKIYIPEKNIAIMIEDMILVTPTGYENLSASLPKKAAEIETIMSRSGRQRR
jgi:Xaa-Pro aminopeptidase